MISNRVAIKININILDKFKKRSNALADVCAINGQTVQGLVEKKGPEEEDFEGYADLK